MFSLLLVPNADKEKAFVCARDICGSLDFDICRVLLPDYCGDSFSDYGEKITFGETAEIIKDCDAVVAIGGDGTVIRAARLAAEAGKPILGINVGRLGYTASIEPTETSFIEKLISGDYQTEKRMLLEVSVYSKDGSVISRCSCVNDAVISRGSASRIIDISVRIDGSGEMRYRADGMIFSTPTGSTAYSLSAGGPIIDPAVSCIELTPICPHSLLSRPMMCSPDSYIDAYVPESGHKSEIFLTVDGNDVISLEDSRRVHICRSSVTADFIKIKETSFSDVVIRKMLGTEKRGV